MKKIFVILLAFLFGDATVLSAQALNGNADSFCTLGGKQGGSISKNEIQNADRLVFSGTDTTLKVTHFRLSVTAKNFPYREFSTDGEWITQEMRDYILKAPLPAKFYIEYIKVGKQGVSRAIAPLAFTVNQ